MNIQVGKPPDDREGDSMNGTGKSVKRQKQEKV